MCVCEKKYKSRIFKYTYPLIEGCLALYTVVGIELSDFGVWFPDSRSLTLSGIPSWKVASSESISTVS